MDGHHDRMTGKTVSVCRGPRVRQCDETSPHAKQTLRGEPAATVAWAMSARRGLPFISTR
jgi:hypothetical protein